MASEHGSTASGGFRMSRDKIEARIADTDYIRIGATVTVCSLTLDNGFSVRGESACVDPAIFDQAVGEMHAYEDAFRKLWAPFAFLELESRYRAGKDT